MSNGGNYGKWTSSDLLTIAKNFQNQNSMIG